jgi:hypothetical protein
LVTGQWVRISYQDSPEARRSVARGSVADPGKEIVSPTFQVAERVGKPRVAVGALLPAIILSGYSGVSYAPLMSATLSATS